MTTKFNSSLELCIKNLLETSDRTAGDALLLSQIKPYKRKRYIYQKFSTYQLLLTLGPVQLLYTSILETFETPLLFEKITPFLDQLQILSVDSIGG